MRVLVAYGTKYGSTEEVAAAVTATLRERGLDVELQAAAAVDNVDTYDAVVLCGALYFGRLHADATGFLARHRGELSKQPVAVFGMGPKTTDAKDMADSRAQLDKALERFPEVSPRAVAIFGGVVAPTKLRFPLNRLPASDARDWHAIEAWAEKVGEEFAAAIAQLAR